MTLPLLVAGEMLAALAIYALTGGADFGGGTWDLLARGERADALRRAIERALAPVWEANHVWLVFVLAICWTAYPEAFASPGGGAYGIAPAGSGSPSRHRRDSARRPTIAIVPRAM